MNRRVIIQGFSLVELSIVLVIIGLIAGGVMTGKSLIRSANLNSVLSEYDAYVKASDQFELQYKAFAGDLPNATYFWGKDTAACNGHTGTAATPGTCNGNGDGLIDLAAAGNATGEAFQYWKQLALSGLIEGQYSGLSGVAGYASLLDVNIPSSRVKNAGWMVFSFIANAHPQWFDGYYPMPYFFGVQSPGSYTALTALTAAEAKNMDGKIDDGLPGIGKVRSWVGSFHTNCASSNAADAIYKVSTTGLACALIFDRNVRARL